MKLNVTPNSIPKLRTAAAAALSGATSLGAAINLQHNTAGTIGADYHRLFGDPNAALPALRIGKQGDYLDARVQALAASAAHQAVVRTGREFFASAVELLRGEFGRLWGSAWSAAGFTFGSLAMPADPCAALLEFHAYFQLHPERESVERNVNAARALALVTQIDAAQLNVAAKESARVAAKQARDDAFNLLRQRIGDLRGELDLTLEDDDARWYQFGFRRPIDGRIPTPVEGLVLGAGAAGEVIAQWQASARVLNYRVMRTVVGVDEDPVEVGLFSDLTAVIRPLPIGATVRVEVSARNNSGETIPVEATIVVQ
ncbi:MAG TPA: hypothetical protein VFG14_07165 [Chthoniobacteraceae bacterium]|nr:hypothetical protein [Chthoniobacteraceae bacterium]